MTRLLLDVRNAARDDLTDHYIWLAREAGLDVAERMAASAEKALFRLLDVPAIGSPVETRSVELKGLRKWRVPDFPKLLIFYVVDERSLVVLRVLHAARDWLAKLEES